MLTVFDGRIRVDCFQLYVESNSEPFDYTDFHVGGQVNGLCGAVVPGHLHLICGTQYGEVGLVVEVHDDAPPVGDEWEDVVEASFRPGTGTAVVYQLDVGTACELPLRASADYRVRYSAVGMDGADSYSLQFWPAPAAPDAVLRQGSARAAYWHDHARSMPPPPAELVEERVAVRPGADDADARQEALKRAVAERAAQDRRQGARTPTKRPRAVPGS